MRFGGLEFTSTEGSWVEGDNTLTQNGTSAGGRCYAKVKTNFRLEVIFKIEETDFEQGRPIGEAKIIFSDADKGEEYRIDFMLSWNGCRVTLAGTMAVLVPLRLRVAGELSTRITVRNNFLTIEADGMTILKDLQLGTRSDGLIGLGTFRSRVSFRDLRVTELIPKTCFVIMPFDERRNFLYEYVVLQALREHPKYDFEIQRADKFLTSERITDEIISGIEKADLLIVDITEDNMNVFYELGYGHAKKRQAILLKEAKSSGLAGETPDKPGPFDIKDYRYHSYEFTPEGFGTLKGKLKDMVSVIFDEPEAKIPLSPKP